MMIKFELIVKNISYANSNKKNCHSVFEKTLYEFFIYILFYIFYLIRKV